MAIIDSYRWRYRKLYQISIATRDINSESQFEYDLTEEDKNTLTLLLLCKLAFTTGNL